ncbi:TPA: hypothetical protein H1016_03545 [archaeon]|uniref:Zn-ribbon containing protein n=1 Tax=Candidatus Naiadarchaeum limnaeum TaxID=2756139 RepID=A0A832V1S7_9ARCH|nr:hypothetical protein [Candidatus Naiadarchaeum limnaeum]
MHQCLKCKKMYSNEEVPIVEGCECGSRLFLFIRNPADIIQAQIHKKELEQKIADIDKEREQSARPRKAKGKFGVETIKVHDIGVYSIHLEALMKGAPIIVLSKSGSYIISFPSLFGEKIEVPLK